MRKGVVLAASSYVAWGLFPAYFLLLRSVSPVEVLAHRMIWSLVFLSCVLAYRRQWSWLRPLTRQLIVSFAVSAALLSGNWFLYIWAVSRGHVIDASLGYFINPLVNIVLGYVLLHERLRPAQWFAVVIAALGVFWLTWQGHHFPWIAVVLALTFGFYGLMRKVAALGPLEGLSLETLLLCPLAAAYLAWTAFIGDNAFIHADFALRLVIMAAGPVTAIPLLLFAAGARRIRLSTLGLLQFIAPTLQLLLGIWMFHEPFGGARRWGFAIIWAALALYSAEGLLRNWWLEPRAAATSRAPAAD
ncbi:MAG TPA: EamA family transporter RarD [Steroidobacteraceae bacterium]|nr:EamA family transporter RarD [Steroidobacteraceae bacterium]